MRRAAASTPLELPGGEAANVNVELIEAGVVAIVGELDLELHLLLRYTLAANRAFSADAWTAPGAIGSAVRKVATLNGLARLRSENLFVGHGAPRRATSNTWRDALRAGGHATCQRGGRQMRQTASPEGRQLQGNTDARGGTDESAVNPRQREHQAMENSDLQSAAERALAILRKLDEHESNVALDDDPNAVIAVRFALLDAAQEHLAPALDVEREPQPVVVAG
jgi:hypothetical protein